MENPRADKVAVVDEVREKLNASDAVLLTEYRGLSVAALKELRTALRSAGGEYKIYKNTLVRLAVADLDVELDDLLTGPTAIAFVGERPDGSAPDAVLVAKALAAFSKANPALVVKGGLLGEALLSADDAKALANVAPREELLARLAGGLAAPLQQFAGLLQALPRNLAYGLSALIEKGGASDAPVDAGGATDAPADAGETSEPSDAPATEDTATDVAAEPVADEQADEAPAADSGDDTKTDAATEAAAEAPEAEASQEES